MRIALIQSEGRGDDAGLRLARLLRDRGHLVTLVVPQATPPAVLPDGFVSGQTFTPAFANDWRAEGFGFIPLGPARLQPAQEHFPRDPAIATARSLSDLLQAFDAAWFFGRHWAAPAARDRRFRDRTLPLLVLDERPDPLLPAETLEDLNRSGASHYAARWADRELVPTVVGIEELEALHVARETEPPRLPRAARTTPAVTVCIPYFEAPRWLPLTLESLERQTSTDFTVIAVDDGSFSAEGRAVFDECAAKYAARGWRFLRQTNQSSGAARNFAAREAASEFLLFLDSDDLLQPNGIERFLRGALLTGDVCLVAPNFGFGTDPEGPCPLLYDPPGQSLVASMGDDMHGGSCIFIERETFLRYRFNAVRGVGFEDYELHVRLNLAGEPWDVLPEYVYRYRMPQAHSVSRSTQQYSNHAAVLRWYRDKLQPAGLGQLPLAIASEYWRNEMTRRQLEPLAAERAWRGPRRGAQGKQIKLLLLTANFPYGIVSGWHLRVQQMIRYFGSRYQVTLVTRMIREQFAPVRKESLAYLHAVRGVEGDDRCASRDPELPFALREHYTETFKAALGALATHEYHAAILDSIFMAESRKNIQTKCILTEHNIESRLLFQAAERGSRPLADATPPETDASALFANANRMARYEDRAWAEFPLRAVCSQVDRAQMDRRVHQGTTVVVPNGADLETWLPDARFDAQTVLFPAHLRYPPNVDAVEYLLDDIWPRVRRQMPQARLILAGRDPAESVKALAARAGGVELRVNPPSMHTIAREASLVAVPLRLGSGTRLKILEAMAWGLPVVSTTLGAEGIEVSDGENLLLADSAEAIAENLVRLLSDQALWTRLRMAGRELIRERYSWDKVFEPLEVGLRELIG
jgi:glycosyltransferase involved in cell wall biosynthesis